MSKEVDISVVLTPMGKEDAPSWARERAFTSERALLHGSWYEVLRGHTIAAESDGLPWERGIVVIERLGGKSRHRVRRLFHGASSAGIKKDSIGLDATAMYALRISPGDVVHIRLSMARNPLSAALDRMLFAWDHPEHATRIAFKLGMLGVALGVLGILDPLLTAVLALPN